MSIIYCYRLNCVPSGSSGRFYFLRLQNYCGWWLQPWNPKMLAPWKESSDKLNILKSRDITLLTKIHIVKVMVFPVVMYRYESWTIKKAKCWRIDAFKLWCWRRLLRSPLDCKEIKPKVNPKGNLPEYSLEGLKLKLKLQYFCHLMQKANSLEKTLMLGKIEGKRRRGWQRMR